VGIEPYRGRGERFGWGRGLLGESVEQEVGEGGGMALVGEAGAELAVGGGGDPSAKGGVGGKFEDAASEGLWLVWGDEEASDVVGDDLGDAPDVGGEDGCTGGDGLKEDEAEGFGCGVEDEEVGGTEDLGDILTGSGEVDAGLEAEVADLGEEGVAMEIVAVEEGCADDGEVDLGRAAGDEREGVDKARETFARGDHANGAEECVGWGDAEGASEGVVGGGLSGEAIQVDAVVENPESLLERERTGEGAGGGVGDGEQGRAAGEEGSPADERADGVVGKIVLDTPEDGGAGAEGGKGGDDAGANRVGVQDVGGGGADHGA
jgi:hypothetical protein